MIYCRRGPDFGVHFRFPVVADATGTWTAARLDPDPSDLPGIYLFEVAARTMPTLVGTNTY
jgi:hypothetical protein